MSTALTARELEIVEGIKRHRTYAEIGEACEPRISEATVRAHVRNIARKLSKPGEREARAPRMVVYDFATGRAD